jgi:2-oxoisovalerate dehydrogenase E1 component
MAVEGRYPDKRQKSIAEGYKKDIQAAVDVMFAEPEPVADTAEELADVYAPAPAAVTPTNPANEVRFIDAITDGLREAMRRHPELVLMGQDIADYGGVFKITQGFVEEFGKASACATRRFAKAAIVGISLGLSLKWYKKHGGNAVCRFRDLRFQPDRQQPGQTALALGPNRRCGGAYAHGRRHGRGSFHSQSNEAWFTHVPGLKVVYPSTPPMPKGCCWPPLKTPIRCCFLNTKPCTAAKAAGTGRFLYR